MCAVSMMPPLFSLENLYRQYLRCRRQKRNIHNALRFEVRLEENLLQLHEELEGRTCHPFLKKTVIWFGLFSLSGFLVERN